MPLWLNWLIAILLIVFLATVFIVSFVLYRKTPPPKGCEDLLPEEKKCSCCSQIQCPYHPEEKKDGTAAEKPAEKPTAASDAQKTEEKKK